MIDLYSSSYWSWSSVSIWRQRRTRMIEKPQYRDVLILVSWILFFFFPSTPFLKSSWAFHFSPKFLLPSFIFFSPLRMVSSLLTAAGTVWAIRGLKPVLCLTSRFCTCLTALFSVVFWPFINQLWVCTACHAAHRDTICYTNLHHRPLSWHFPSLQYSKICMFRLILILSSNKIPLCSVPAYLFNLSLSFHGVLAQ